MSDKLFYLLQVNDALFPIGGYSHSQGLETYIQKGIVHDVKTAEEYIHQKLKWSLEYTDLLAVRFAYEYARNEDIEGILELEDLLEASRIPEEQRDASKKMGSRFAKTVEKLGLEEVSEGIFKQYMDARKGKVMNHCCIYGVFCGAIGVGLEEVLSHYLYGQTSAMVTNCVKTIPLSQTAGQQILAGCYSCFQEILHEVLELAIDDLCLSAPGFDIRGIQHEKLYSRIYMS
jgi:urease accessory protein